MWLLSQTLESKLCQINASEATELHIIVFCFVCLFVLFKPFKNNYSFVREIVTLCTHSSSNHLSISESALWRLYLYYRKEKGKTLIVIWKLISEIDSLKYTQLPLDSNGSCPFNVFKINNDAFKPFTKLSLRTVYKASKYKYKCLSSWYLNAWGR